MKPKLCVYHKGCADGQGAAIAFDRKYPNTEFYPGVYSEDPPDVEGRDVYLVDFSYPVPVLEKMLAVAEHVTIIDHHRTAIEALAYFNHPKLTKVLSLDNSGAVLTWKYLFPQERVPDVLYHIEDRDLWRFESKFTRPITAYLYSLEFNIREWSKFLDTVWWYQNANVFIVAGEALVRQDEQRVKALATNARVLTIGGHKVPAVNANHFFASDLGHELGQGQVFAASYYIDRDSVKYSLRSDPNGLDVSEIAKQYGGGGHKHAAGFVLTFAEARDKELL